MTTQLNTQDQVTIKSILADDNMLCSLHLKDFNIKVFLVYKGSDKVQYYMFVGDTILFQGDDFKPSPLYNIDDLESIVSLLGFLTIGIHDIGEEFFKDYTPSQLNWATDEYGDREQLSVLLNDFENDDSEYHKQAVKKFKKAFNKL